MSALKLAQFLVLPELELIKARKIRHGTLGFLCKKQSAYEVCPKCASISTSVYDHRRVHVKDEPIRNKAVVLIIIKRRFYCKTCKKPFTEPVSGIGKGCRTTERFRSGICWAAENFADLSKVQKHYQCSADTVYRSTYQQLELRRRKKLYPLPPAIGIDEHSLRKPKYQSTVYSTVIVDHPHRRVYEVFEGRSKEDLQVNFDKLIGKQNVRLVTMDLSPTFRAIAREHFPHAAIVADRFHVQRLFTKCVNRMRKAVTGDKRTHPIRKLLLRNAEELEWHERRSVIEWLNFHPDLREVYQYKEAMHRLYRIKGHKRAKRAFTKLTDRMGNSKIPEVKRIRATLLDWRIEILNYHKHNGMSNGRVEGFNRKAKLCQRSAYGFKKFKNYRLKLLNMCR